MDDQAAQPERPPAVGDDLGPAVDDTIYPTFKPFDPTRSRELTRGWLAAWSFGLFTLVTLLLTAAVVCGWRTWDEVEGLATSVVPVVVSVVGTTTGFYFGGKGDRHS